MRDLTWQERSQLKDSLHRCGKTDIGTYSDWDLDNYWWELVESKEKWEELFKMNCCYKRVDEQIRVKKEVPPEIVVPKLDKKGQGSLDF